MKRESGEPMFPPHPHPQATRPAWASLVVVAMPLLLLLLHFDLFMSSDVPLDRAIRSGRSSPLIDTVSF